MYFNNIERFGMTDEIDHLTPTSSTHLSTNVQLIGWVGRSIIYFVSQLRAPEFNSLWASLRLRILELFPKI